MVDLDKRGLEDVLIFVVEFLFFFMELFLFFFLLIFNSDCEWFWLLFCEEFVLYIKDIYVNMNI